MNYRRTETFICRKDWGRAVERNLFGFACYEARATDMPEHLISWHHVGVVGDGDEAMRWLRGDEPMSLIRVFGGG